MKGGKMEKQVKITLIISVAVLLAICIVGIGIFKLVNPIGGQVITVDGSSTIKVNPDLVTINFNIETNGSDAKTAKDANEVILTKLVDGLISLGFAREDIKTQSLNIYPWQEWNGNKMVDKGYKASHQITVELNTSDASMIAKVIDAGVDSGALLSYINFELSDSKQNEYKAQALKQAGTDARTKAVAIAEGLGMKIGSKPVSVTTSSFNYNPWNVYSNAGMMRDVASTQEAKLAVTNIVPGDQTVYGNIQVTYKLY
jgi:hypothetical protein